MLEYQGTRLLGARAQMCHSTGVLGYHGAEKKSSELLGCQGNGGQGVRNQGTMAPGVWGARLLGCRDDSLPELWLG